MQGTFIFHPVGQGLFYEGRIGNFTFVYDCGSLTNGIANRVTRNLSCRSCPLSMLVISHFHEDHINGLPQLLRDAQGKWNVKEVVLPYLNPAERLVAAAEYLIQYRRSHISQDYIDFLVDPVRYFGGEDNDGPNITFILPGEPEENWATLEQGDGTGVDGNWLDTTKDTADYPPELASIGSEKKVKIQRHSSRYQVGDWCFKFYCTPCALDQRLISKIKKAGFLGNNGTTIDASKLRNRAAIKCLKTIYRAVFKTHVAQNNISLLCCHGPISDVPRSCKVYPEITSYKHFTSIGCPGHCSFSHPLCMPKGSHQMLTGDAHIDLDAFTKHFEDELGRVGISLVPHHGAARNWRCGLPAAMVNCTAWVASFGTRNRYGHPGVAPVACVSAWGRAFLECTEYNSWRVVAH